MKRVFFLALVAVTRAISLDDTPVPASLPEAPAAAAAAAGTPPPPANVAAAAAAELPSAAKDPWASLKDRIAKNKAKNDEAAAATVAATAVPPPPIAPVVGAAAAAVAPPIAMEPEIGASIIPVTPVQPVMPMSATPAAPPAAPVAAAEPTAAAPVGASVSAPISTLGAEAADDDTFAEDNGRRRQAAEKAAADSIAAAQAAANKAAEQAAADSINAAAAQAAAAQADVAAPANPVGSAAPQTPAVPAANVVVDPAVTAAEEAARAWDVEEETRRIAEAEKLRVVDEGSESAAEQRLADESAAAAAAAAAAEGQRLADEDAAAAAAAAAAYAASATAAATVVAPAEPLVAEEHVAAVAGQELRVLAVDEAAVEEEAGAQAVAPPTTAAAAASASLEMERGEEEELTVHGMAAADHLSASAAPVEGAGGHLPAAAFEEIDSVSGGIDEVGMMMEEPIAEGSVVVDEAAAATAFGVRVGAAIPNVDDAAAVAAAEAATQAEEDKLWREEDEQLRKERELSLAAEEAGERQRQEDRAAAEEAELLRQAEETRRLVAEEDARMMAGEQHEVAQHEVADEQENAMVADKWSESSLPPTTEAADAAAAAAADTASALPSSSFSSTLEMMKARLPKMRAKDDESATTVQIDPRGGAQTRKMYDAGEEENSYGGGENYARGASSFANYDGGVTFESNEYDGGGAAGGAHSWHAKLLIPAKSFLGESCLLRVLKFMLSLTHAPPSRSLSLQFLPLIRLSRHRERRRRCAGDLLRRVRNVLCQALRLLLVRHGVPLERGLGADERSPWPRAHVCAVSAPLQHWHGRSWLAREPFDRGWHHVRSRHCTALRHPITRQAREGVWWRFWERRSGGLRAARTRGEARR